MIELSFEELKKIDRNPFSDNMMDMDIWGMEAAQIAYKILSIELIYFYLNKFFKTYEIPLLCRSFLLTYKDLFRISIETEDDYIELLQLYESNQYELADSVFLMTGWESISFYGSDIDEYMSSIKVDNYQYTNYQMNSFFTKTLGANSPIMPVCQKMSDIIEDSIGIDGGESWVFYNKQLGTYKRLREQYKDIVNSKLSDEYKFIDILLGELDGVLNNMWSRDSGYAGDYYYITFCIGYDGYTNYGWDLLNYNVIISLFVLKEALNDFAMKLYQLLEEPEIEYIA